MTHRSAASFAGALVLLERGAGKLARSVLWGPGAAMLPGYPPLNRMTDKEFTDYWTYLVKKKYSTKAALSSDERVFYAANIFRGSVPRSGLIGYFENTKCDVIRDAHQALVTLGLSEAVRLLQDAQKIVLHGAPLPETDQCISLFDYDLPEEELELAMNDLDSRVSEIQHQLYLQDQAIFDSLCRFADEKRLRAPKG